ncbi:CPBP family intramembrane glutamic endopeptidase [Propionibacterium australiense]|uniref:CPBP family intramembrane metalloprotease n=1 Tax=Propionibacterium australiense TaxID=119981 RepID=A0A8B3FPN6_9ACTN|nr:CPBP family intramembrane glutamic endopeptidase [Propionibacterium australiense]RLP12911.1 CPBP family intramembrane metalloprotease [Propionibacterium australiense]
MNGQPVRRRPASQSPPVPEPLVGVRPGVPAAGAGYTEVMIDGSASCRTRAALGLITVAFGYLVVTTLLMYAGSAVSWLARGRDGSFSEGYARVASYGVVEGVAVVNLALAAVTLVVLAVARWINGRAPGWLCSVQGCLRLALLGIGVVVGLVVLNGVYLLSRIGREWDTDPPSRAWLWALLVVLTSPLQAAGEEFLFRGYVQQAVGALTGRRWIAVGASALVFALMHGTQNAALFADRLGFGLVAAGMVVATGGLEASIAVHAANNVSSFCYAIAAGTLTKTRQLTETSWSTTAFNLVAYVISGALMVLVARLLAVRRATDQTLV